MKTIDDALKESLKKKTEERIEEEVKQKILDAYYDFSTIGVGKITNKKEQQ